MNTRLRYGLAALACVLVFCVSLGGTLADWSVAQDSLGRLTLGSVKGEIIETYEQGCTVMPGQEVQKTVNIKNTGNVDCVIRVKLTKSWQDSAALDPEFIRITCDNELWYYDTSDGYYYYKGVLAPGQITQKALMDSFTLDCSAGSDYAGKKADIAVRLECVQAGGNGISVWNKSFEQLGIDYNPEAPAIPTIYVGFIAPESGFEFDAYEGDLFMNFKQLVPGEARSEVLKVANQYDEQVEIFLRAQLPDDVAADAQKTALVNKLLGEYALITIKRADGTVVYSGPVWAADVSAQSMRENLSLGQFGAESSQNFTVELELSPIPDNSYRELLGSV